MPRVDVLPWDSAFFGFKIARVLPDRSTQDELATLVDQADRSGINCLYWLISCDDPASTRAAEALGFHMVDIRVTLEQDLGPCSETTQLDLASVRLCAEEDLPALLALARQSHHESRFFFDSNFPQDRSAALYEEWIRRGLRTSTDTILVAGPPGKPAGYCVSHLSNDEAGSIELIAVAPAAREAGVGTALVSAALRHFKDSGMRRATVVTQGRNIASQRLYQKCGFLTRSVQLWYHRWSAARHQTSQ